MYYIHPYVIKECVCFTSNELNQTKINEDVMFLDIEDY
jgi:hypothetical protein